MTYIGDFQLGDTFDVKFTTIDATGLGSSLSGGAVVAYAGNDTVEISAGLTLTADFDGRTGLNNVRVIASGANGFAANTNYVLVLSAGTVAGVSVNGYVLVHFSIEARTMKANVKEVNDIAVTGTGVAPTPWGPV